MNNLNETQKNKIARFINDPVMSETVRYVLEAELSRPSKDRDVNMLAAHFLAIEIISNAWKELSKYKDEGVEVDSQNSTPHV